MRFRSLRTELNMRRKKKKKKNNQQEKAPNYVKRLGTFATTTSTKLIDSNWNAMCYVLHFTTINFSFSHMDVERKSLIGVASHISQTEPIWPTVSQYTQFWILKIEKRYSRTLNLWFGVTSCIHKHEIYYWFSFCERNSGHWLILVIPNSKQRCNFYWVLFLIFGWNENVRSTTIAAVYFQ